MPVINAGEGPTTCTKNLTGCHVLDNADAEMFVQHGVQPADCIRQQALQLLKVDVYTELHHVLRVMACPELVHLPSMTVSCSFNNERRNAYRDRGGAIEDYLPHL